MEFLPKHREGQDFTRKGSACCVVNCNSKKNINANLSFHKVPKSGTIAIKNLAGETVIVDRRSEWLKRLNIKDYSKQILVCSLHFSVEDYVFPDLPSSKRCLRTNAVPIPVSVSLNKRKNDIARIKRLNNRKPISQNKKNGINKKCFKNNQIKSQDILKNDMDNNSNNTSESMIASSTNDTIQENSFDRDLFRHYIHKGVCVADMLQNISEPDHHDSDCEDSCEAEMMNEKDYSLDKIPETNIEYLQKDEGKENNSTFCKNCSNKVQCDQGTQVTSGDLTVSFCKFIKTTQDLMTMCNIKSFAILDELVKSMEKYYPQQKKCILSTRECIILTTTKLKLDIPFSALGIMFNQVSYETVRNVFYGTVKKLATILQSVLTRVSKEEILQNMPKCFKKYQDTTSVFDCTEIKIQQPKCLKCCLKFYSHYKGGLTVKFMTEVTPAGMIVAVSEAFGGRASDKAIFNQTNVLQHLESTRDAVMVDKGFLIDDECAERRMKLIRPPFLRKQKQLPEKDSVENRDIACARVHIERMNQHIKLMRMLNNKIPWHFVHYIDDIFIVCCGLANLGTPILADDKFD